jgi:beta-glucosidase
MKTTSQLSGTVGSESKLAIAALFLPLVLCWGSVIGQSTDFAFQDQSLPLEERVADLVSRMTLEEKVGQMMYGAPAIDRLGVPAYNWWNECLHGVGRAGLATVFPQAVGMAATWDDELIHRVATVISDEARAKHHEFARREKRDIYQGLTFWTPNINIFRDPRWGRGQETYGEDPYLTGRMAVSFIKGLQGDDPKYLKLVATAKHFAVHSGPEPDRHTFDAVVDERDLRETYLPAFEATVREADVHSVMCAYNRYLGEAACASSKLLGDILRDEWDFGGYVVSDCWAIVDIYRNHKIVATPQEAAALAVKTGTDLNCGSTYPSLVAATQQGLITEEELDAAVKRLFRARFLLGMFDDPAGVPWSKIPYSVVASPGHQELALETTRKSLVLLKNENSTLPLQKDLTSIAVIGPNADDPIVLSGNYNGTAPELITPLEGIRRAVASETKVYTAIGTEITEGVPPMRPIPSQYLRPADRGSVQSGLTVTYFATQERSGDMAARRIEPTVNFIWRDNTPLGKGMAAEFSAVVEGFLVPPVSGTYRLGVSGLTGYRLFLDGEKVVEFNGVHQPHLLAKDVELEKGRFYSIRLEYWNRSSAPQLQLVWGIHNQDYMEEAIEIARKSEVIVFVGGLTPRLEGEEMPVKVEGFLGGDRTDIALPWSQRVLLRKLHSLGKPVVLVLMNGSAVADPWSDQNLPAILTAWYPGQAGGRAIADVLFGDYNPAGRLPVTFYRSVEDLPDFSAYEMAGRTYRYFEGTPLYPFGHGLSYTSFGYENLAVTPEEQKGEETVTIAVDVINRGRLHGDEVVQLYVSNKQASVPVAIRSLQGFRRIRLAPGAKKRVEFELKPSQFSVIDKDSNRVVEPGEIEISVGGKQPGFSGNADASTTEVVKGRFGVKGKKPVLVKP